LPGYAGEFTAVPDPLVRFGRAKGREKVGKEREKKGWEKEHYVILNISWFCIYLHLLSPGIYALLLQIFDNSINHSH